MKIRSTLVLFLGLGLAAGFVATPAIPQGTDAIIKLPQDIEFKGPLSGPPQTVVVYGAPTKPGVFVSRVKFSAGWKDPPHWHPDEVRTAVVLSGHSLLWHRRRMGRKQDQGVPGRNVLLGAIKGTALHLGKRR